jgi:hypothetical protein
LYRKQGRGKALKRVSLEVRIFENLKKAFLTIKRRQRTEIKESLAMRSGHSVSGMCGKHLGGNSEWIVI